MRVAYICLDPGIPVFGTKGASVHVQEVLRELRALGHDVVLYTARLGEHVPDDLTDLPVRTVEVAGTTTAEREQSQGRAAEQVAQMVAADGAELVYERYSLFSDALARVVTGSETISSVLEVNSPLVEEQRQHRELVDQERAWDVLAAQVGAASATVCVSEPVAAWVRQHARAAGPGHASAGTRRVMTVPNGVSVRRIQPQPEDPRQVVVTFVGTLKPWHGVSDLLTAASLAQVPWRLRIIGSGPQLPALRSQAAELGLDVDFRGAVAPQDMPDHLAGSAIGVAPYPDLGGEEQQYFSPLKVLEYLACGLPVVASAVGQVPQLLEGLGTLVPPSDPRSLAQAIDALAADPSQRAQVGALGRRRAEQRHSWAGVVATVLDAAGVGRA